MYLTRVEVHVRCVQTFTDVREGRRKQTSWKAIYLYFIGAAASAHKIDAAIEKGCTSGPTLCITLVVSSVEMERVTNFP